MALMLEVDEKIGRRPHPSVQEREIILPLQLEFTEANARLARAQDYTQSIGCPRCYIDEGVRVPLEADACSCARCNTSFEPAPQGVEA